MATTASLRRRLDAIDGATDGKAEVRFVFRDAGLTDEEFSVHLGGKRAEFPLGANIIVVSFVRPGEASVAMEVSG